MIPNHINQKLTALLTAAALFLLTIGCSIALVDEGMPANAGAAALSDNGKYSNTGAAALVDNGNALDTGAAALVGNGNALDTGAAALSEKLIRFHVIANSGSEQDQQLKLQVRDAVVEYLRPLLVEAHDSAEARKLLWEHLSAVTDTANQVLAEADVPYRSQAALAYSEFPLKIYGDVALPPGEYEALRIVLGEGQGQNWWCLMFPPLCFVDSSCGIVPEESKDSLKTLLTDDEYDSVLQKEVKWQPKFLLFEWLKRLF